MYALNYLIFAHLVAEWVPIVGESYHTTAQTVVSGPVRQLRPHQSLAVSRSIIVCLLFRESQYVRDVIIFWCFYCY